MKDVFATHIFFFLFDSLVVMMTVNTMCSLEKCSIYHIAIEQRNQCHCKTVIEISIAKDEAIAK